MPRDLAFPRTISLPDHAPEEAVVCIREMAAALGFREAWSFASEDDHAEAALTAEKLEHLGEHIRDLYVARAEDLRRSLPTSEAFAYCDVAGDEALKWFNALRTEWAQ